MSSKSDLKTLKDHLDLSCEYEPYTLSNTNVGTAKDHGKNYTKVRSLPVRHLLRYRLLDLSFDLGLFSIVLLMWFMRYFVFWILLRSFDLFLCSVEYEIMSFYFIPHCLFCAIKSGSRSKYDLHC